VEVSIAVKRRIAARSLWLGGVLLAVAAGAIAVLAISGRPRAAMGVAGGHLLALACGLSWIAGALTTFDGPFTRFARATLGGAPLRLALVAVGFCGLGFFASEWVDPAALALSFVATHLFVQIAQADCFLKLADAASPPRTRTPLRIFEDARLF
jgi:hypothetical protein